MDTSLAEEKTQTMPTLAPDSFFFMSPYRSFTYVRMLRPLCGTGN